MSAAKDAQRLSSRLGVGILVASPFCPWMERPNMAARGRAHRARHVAELAPRAVHQSFPNGVPRTTQRLASKLFGSAWTARCHRSPPRKTKSIVRRRVRGTIAGGERQHIAGPAPSQLDALRTPQVQRFVEQRTLDCQPRWMEWTPPESGGS